jgi:RNA polymerase sigma factor (TIGR02999 family)
MPRPASAESARPDDITALLKAHRSGDQAAMDRLVPIVYEELHRIAHRQLSGERDGGMLQTTGLVHEAYAKFAELDRIELNDRVHFFALAARLMRQVLIDAAKRRGALKRRGVKVTLGSREDRLAEAGGLDPDALLDLDRALDRLADLSERQARVVECRFFAGMSVEDTAEALDVSVATVKRDWQLARAWLNRELRA